MTRWESGPVRGSPLSSKLRHHSLRLLQPVRHPHLAVHRRRSGQMLLRLLAMARALVEFAEAEVALRDESGDGRARPPGWPFLVMCVPAAKKQA